MNLFHSSRCHLLHRLFSDATQEWVMSASLAKEHFFGGFAKHPGFVAGGEPG
jgi:hypothetical protein